MKTPDERFDELLREFAAFNREWLRAALRLAESYQAGVENPTRDPENVA